MSPEQWRAVRSLLEAALERRAEERRAFLDAACPDPELHREVSSLLAVESAARDFIETPVFDLHADLHGGERTGGHGGGRSGPGPGTRIERAGRFLRRHRRGVAGAALLVGLLAGFAVRETALRRRAEAARAEAQTTVDFLVEMLEQADLTRSAGQEVTVRQMLAGAVARIRADEELAPATRADLLDAMGRAYLGLGLYDGAEPLLEEALATRRRELGPDHLQVAESHYRLFRLHHERGDARAAEKHLREVLAIRPRSGEVEDADFAGGLNGPAQILERPAR
jgi:serine/threonine-protein kinase